MARRTGLSRSEAAAARLTLPQLAVFRAVMMCGSASDAARMLHISQPAASKMLRAIERATGLELFQRLSGRLVPTREATAIFAEVDKIFGALGVVQRMVGNLRDPEAGPVSIAAIPTQANVFLPPVIEEFRRRFPAAQVAVQVLPNQPIIDRVVAGHVDFGLVHDVTPSPETANEDVGHQEVVCLVPKRHPLARKTEVAATDLVGETFISYGPQTTFGRFLDAAFEAAGVAVPVAVEVGASSLICALVARGVGIGLVEAAAVDPATFRRVAVKPFAPRLGIRSRILRSRYRPLSRHAEMFIAIYKEVAEKTSSLSPPIAGNPSPGRPGGPDPTSNLELPP